MSADGCIPFLLLCVCVDPTGRLWLLHLQKRLSGCSSSQSVYSLREEDWRGGRRGEGVKKKIYAKSECRLLNEMWNGQHAESKSKLSSISPRRWCGTGVLPVHNPFYFCIVSQSEWQSLENDSVCSVEWRVMFGLGMTVKIAISKKKGWVLNRYIHCKKLLEIQRTILGSFCEITCIKINISSVYTMC